MPAYIEIGIESTTMPRATDNIASSFCLLKRSIMAPEYMSRIGLDAIMENHRRATDQLDSVTECMYHVAATRCRPEPKKDMSEPVKKLAKDLFFSANVCAFTVL